MYLELLNVNILNFFVAAILTITRFFSIRIYFNLLILLKQEVIIDITVTLFIILTDLRITGLHPNSVFCVFTAWHVRHFLAFSFSSGYEILWLYIYMLWFGELSCQSIRFDPCGFCVYIYQEEGWIPQMLTDLTVDFIRFQIYILCWLDWNIVSKSSLLGGTSLVTWWRLFTYMSGKRDASRDRTVHQV